MSSVRGNLKFFICRCASKNLSLRYGKQNKLIMNTVIAERLSALREVMKRERLAAFVFPSTDPHNSEYVPDHWKGREWISGFDGSAGVAVVTLTHAALWTDSRYFIAAANQLAGTEFQLMKQGLPDTPAIADWLGAELQQGDSTEIGMDGQVNACLLYTSPSPRDISGSRMPSSA